MMFFWVTCAGEPRWPEKLPTLQRAVPKAGPTQCCYCCFCCEQKFGEKFDRHIGGKKQLLNEGALLHVRYR